MFKKLLKYRYPHWLVLILVVIVAVAGLKLSRAKAPVRHLSDLTGQTGPHRQPGFTFISPLLWYDVPESKNFEEFADLEKRIHSVVDNETHRGNASQVSVYFRDLRYGRWIGINENDNYAPSSLLKVPLMIAYFREAETVPGILNQELTYHGQDETSSDEVIKPSETIKPGVAYTVNELIRRMIVFSDNNATTLLLGQIDKKSLSEVYTDLGLQIPDAANLQDTMSAKVFASFFRILYNASYLHRADSEQALKLLSQSDFNSGMQAALPKDVLIAHKFGVRTFIYQNQTFQELHECGLVYHKQNPFLLCIMTKGQDIKGLETTLADITRLVYQQVDKGYKH